ncbi:hypothetical protein TgHK011_000098 [Trichoderma gracile]|nr:hypothetical protein TgHK011_000098 [Trichoderma gracile]
MRMTLAPALYSGDNILRNLQSPEPGCHAANIERLRQTGHRCRERRGVQRQMPLIRAMDGTGLVLVCLFSGFDAYRETGFYDLRLIFNTTTEQFYRRSNRPQAPSRALRELIYGNTFQRKLTPAERTLKGPLHSMSPLHLAPYKGCGLQNARLSSIRNCLSQPYSPISHIPA